jgi:ABC-type multidrug transport system ATPase subunit
MQGRTVILVSHHLQLCAPGASYIAALENGRLLFEGSKEGFYSSGIMKTLVQSSGKMDEEEKVTSENEGETEELNKPDSPSETNSTVAPSSPASSKADKKPARRLMEEEKREVGRVVRAVWETYIQACGNKWYWSLFISFLIIVSASPVLENGWLK